MVKSYQKYEVLVPMEVFFEFLRRVNDIIVENPEHIIEVTWKDTVIKDE